MAEANRSAAERLLEIHGPGDCSLCKQPKAGEGSPICSYPHGRMPVAPVAEAGFGTWGFPADAENGHTAGTTYLIEVALDDADERDRLFTAIEDLVVKTGCVGTVSTRSVVDDE